MILVGVALFVYGAVQDHPALSDLIFTDRDIARGYTLPAPLSGALTPVTARVAGVSGTLDESESPHGWIRGWQKPGSELGIRLVDLASARVATRGGCEIIEGVPDGDSRFARGARCA